MAENKRAGLHAHASGCPARLGQCEYKHFAQSKEHVADVALASFTNAVVRASPRMRTIPTPHVDRDARSQTKQTE